MGPCSVNRANQQRLARGSRGVSRNGRRGRCGDPGHRSGAHAEPLLSLACVDVSAEPLPHVLTSVMLPSVVGAEPPS